MSLFTAILASFFISPFGCIFGTELQSKDYLQLPIAESDIHLIDTAEKLYHAVNHISENSDVVGIKGKGNPNMGIFKERLALFQLAIKDSVYLLDTAALKDLETQPMCDFLLKKIFHKEGILKLGYGVESDLKLLMQTLKCEKDNENMNTHLVDLGSFFRKLGEHYPEMNDEFERPLSSEEILELKGLNRLSRTILGKWLYTGAQYSDWERRPLSQAQVDFAAREVYSLLMVYEKILPLLQDKDLDFEAVIRSNFLQRRSADEKEINGDYEVSSPCKNENDNINWSIPEKKEWYPSYHLAPPEGWMNDPNGLIEFEGYFHAFYQYNPSAPVWGDIHWGHARSKNLIEWEHLPAALAPSIEEDKDGCFSGSAVDNTGTLTLMYTGNVFLENDELRQVTCMATSNDTINFTKLGKVLDPPKGVQHFRDPKVWWGGDDTWYMVMGTRDADLGEAHLYKSEDLRQWKFERLLAKADKGFGYMWECPDFFPLGDKHLLALSPQGIPAKGYQYRNLYQSGYYLGTWKPGGEFRIERNFTEMDNGHDFYAPQSFLTSDQRRIVIAWMAMWESPFPESAQGWAGMLSLPRELTLAKDGKVLSQPVREVEDFRKNEKLMTATLLKNQYLELESNAKAMEIIMFWNISCSDAEKFGLYLGESNHTAGGLFLYVDTQAERLTLDRRYPQYSVSGYRSIPLPGGDLLSLRVFLDHSSVEVFVNGGSNVMSSRIYPAKDQRRLFVFAENGNALLSNSYRWLIDTKYVA